MTAAPGRIPDDGVGARQRMEHYQNVVLKRPNAMVTPDLVRHMLDVGPPEHEGDTYDVIIARYDSALHRYVFMLASELPCAPDGITVLSWDGFGDWRSGGKVGVRGALRNLQGLGFVEINTFISDQRWTDSDLWMFAHVAMENFLRMVSRWTGRWDPDTELNAAEEDYA
jgi:hypothetical protein